MCTASAGDPDEARLPRARPAASGCAELRSSPGALLCTSLCQGKEVWGQKSDYRPFIMTFMVLSKDNKAAGTLLLWGMLSPPGSVPHVPSGGMSWGKQPVGLLCEAHTWRVAGWERRYSHLFEPSEGADCGFLTQTQRRPPSALRASCPSRRRSL